ISFLYAYENFSNEYSKFNSVMQGFESIQSKDLLIVHAQIINKMLYLVLKNIGENTIVLESIEIKSNISMISLNINSTLEQGNIKLFQFYIGTFEVVSGSSIIVYYTETGVSRVLNETASLV
ncbi:MAG TPA: hypothetical protein VKU94_06000, partial [Geobacterales bacterium]|nr:hypothetical protein [Geobacterales bacterium]